MFLARALDALGLFELPTHCCFPWQRRTFRVVVFLFVRAFRIEGLVDELQTSSEYLMQHMRKGMEVLSLTYSAKPKGLAGMAKRGDK